MVNKLQTVLAAFCMGCMTLLLTGCQKGAPPAFDATATPQGSDSAKPRPARDSPPFVSYEDMLEAESKLSRLLSASDSSELSPAETVELLTRLHQAQSKTREWEMLDCVGKRRWCELARRVARKHPQAVRDAVRKGSPVGSDLAHALASVEGEENAVFLGRHFLANPTLDNVIALGNAGGPAAAPVLHKAMEMDDVAISHQAGVALLRQGDPNVVQAIAKHLRSSDARRQDSALGLAGQAADRRLLPVLREIDPQLKGTRRKDLRLATVACGSDRYLEQVHEQALDEAPYLVEFKQRPPDPAMLHIVHNYPQNEALTAIASLGCPKSLATLDQLATNARDPKIRKRAAEIAQRIRGAQ